MPEITLEDRLREVMALQKTIAVPHKLPDASVTVIRIQPDGIHVQKASGIVMIAMEELPEALQEKYHIQKDIGDLYRVLMQRRSAQAQQAIDKQNEALNLAAVEQRATEALKKEQRDAQKKAEEAQKTAAIALQQWAEYDRRYADYLVRRRVAESEDRRQGRVVRMPVPPAKPNLPRPY